MMLCALLAASAILWQDPGPIDSKDLTIATPTPKPPYSFLKEDFGGTSPKVYVRDADGVEWRVKGGRDIKPETFITRFVSALGYFAETTHFFASGKIEGVPQLKRASGFIKPDGSFTWASFEKVEKDGKFVGSWRWVDNPFKDTRELKGLKVLVMLFSNWDNKDQRNERKGSNVSILELRDGRQVYFVNDWGQSMGAWGRYFGRANWNCAHYESQTPSFTGGGDRGMVKFGYGGEHTGDFKEDIRVEDVQWLMQYLGRITDAQIRMGLKAAGADAQEEDCFARSIRARIEQLRRITLQ